MIFRMKPTSTPVMRPRVTPHPDQAAALQRRINALAYCPENGFHRDHRQQRQERAAFRLMFSR
jgi:hypothetical protein